MSSILANSTWIILSIHVVLAIISAGHALLYKRDPRAALGWIAVCIAYPIVGPLLYYLFGINRLRTHAHQFYAHKVHTYQNNSESHKQLESGHKKSRYERPDTISSTNELVLPESLQMQTELAALARSSTAVTNRPLVEKNAIQPYFDGDSTYAAMLKAIKQARFSICLASYIFETNQTGRTFIDALSAAQKRGVEVCVLLDGIGELYNYPRAGRLLKKAGINFSRFLPPRLLPPSVHINLRNHRKLLIVDAKTGFTGGMNIGDRHLKNQTDPTQGTADIHFKLSGEIVFQLQQVFDKDWRFATGEERKQNLEEKDSSIDSHENDNGKAICRVVTDGPDNDLDKLTMIITSAIALARNRVAIMTPYFLPPNVMINAMQAAALRGVQVDIILPEKTNLPLVHWATRNMLWELLQYGVNIYYQPPPFAHSKFLLIDEEYAQIGSANIDPRSLRLNFELGVEIFDREFVSLLSDHFNQMKNTSTIETLGAVDGRSLPTRLRDAFVWLFSPYL